MTRGIFIAIRATMHKFAKTKKTCKKLFQKEKITKGKSWNQNWQGEFVNSAFQNREIRRSHQIEPNQIRHFVFVSNKNVSQHFGHDSALKQ